ncbi:hypothetical protein Cabys_3757 [Caldithrix abyssi DSM 13497]|uniref:Uncharacterized protein n=1 Tax=Caldithrix abyssi DSM 13497 TaxID=880073 RepID=A0A1J1CD65_CALAY|nr:hypothetical protein Cabys_3757 [Caldithrix abyssi DSM 13497]
MRDYLPLNHESAYMQNLTRRIHPLVGPISHRDKNRSLSAAEGERVATLP